MREQTQTERIEEIRQSLLETPIKRYAIYAEPVYENGEMVSVNCVSEERTDKLGQWVRADDVATLTARCEALEQENTQLRHDLDLQHKWSEGETDAAVAFKLRCEALEQLVTGKDAEIDRLDSKVEVLRGSASELKARCEALQTDAGAEIDRLTRQGEAGHSEIMRLEERCEALTAERDQWKDKHYWAVEAHQKTLDKLADQVSRCQHLEQAVRLMDLRCVSFKVQSERCGACPPCALASLLPTQEEGKAPDVCGWDGPDANGMSLTLCGNWVRWHPTFKFCPHCGRSLAGTVAILRDLGPITDENRVSFAAGYSQALDDQAKGLK